ncbi:MAG: type 4a pilus biogenesis protein PilO [Thiohalorhabdus sp.]|uniref:type 4a pilus biogenesis protein PilO n=1 Tax=Thiohalorhabdus sp. TaxID=3094134 RepID=UPI00397EF37C
MDVQDLNLDTALNAPDWVKAVVLLVLTALIGGAFWWFVYLPHQKEVAKMEKRVENLTAQYQKKKRQVANLPVLREQYEKLEERMEGALEQLPDRTEVADLLDAVNDVGVAEGLDFKLFRPAEEVPKESYAALPVELEVRGSFNAMGRFLAATASLPRIVNVEDLQLSGAKDGELTLKGQARTYRFLGEDEQDEEKN